MMVFGPRICGRRAESNRGISEEEAIVIIEDTVEAKPAIKKRILVGSFLALAALGTHWLPARSIVPLEAESHTATVAMASSDKLMTGPNSLLGDAVADPMAKAIPGTDLSQYHLDAEQTTDEAGLTQALNGIAPASDELAIPDESAAVSQASAVPEPRTAGLLLLAVVPLLIRRHRRNGPAT
jgi:hypothetical protein